MAIGIILSSFAASLSQIGDARFRSVLLKGIALTIGLLIAASVIFVWFVGMMVGPEASLPLIGQVTWLQSALTYSSIPLVLLLSVFLMVPVASAITSMFLDEVAQAVEDRHYPGLPPAQNVSFYEGFRDTVNFLGVLVGANAVALILYLIFIPAAPFIFWALNGFLLGREYFTVAAMRRVGRVNAKKLRRKHIGTIWAAGFLMAVPLSIPLVSLIIPILGAATFTHIYHRLTA